MSETCNHDCSSCQKDCDSRQEIAKEILNDASHIKKIIGVVSGKGGVGKSLVSSLLAITMRKAGYRVGILDADITGPSIARIFGCSQKAFGKDGLILPNQSASGIEVVSVNMMLEQEDTPVIWRGPVVAGIVKQFYKDVLWEDLDFLFVDMPPGTGDVPLTVFQSLPVDGIVVVTSPQDLVSMIVAKAVNMAKMMEVPILGVVENMSYLECPDCGKRLAVFGESHLEQTAEQFDVAVLDRLPIRPEIAKACDEGTLEYMDATLPIAKQQLEALLKPIGRIAIPTEDHSVWQHFGKTPLFTAYDVKDGAIVQVSELDPQGQGHGALASVLSEAKVDLVICGGIGQGAIAALQGQGIAVIRGVTGDIDVAVKAYLKGQLHDDPSAGCDHHQQEEDGACGGHCCH